MKEVSIGLIGFGTIGSGVVKVLQRSRDILEARAGLPLRLSRIADLDIVSDRGVSIDRSILTTDAREILEDPGISIVVELIGGSEPAGTYVLDAFRRGKPVVTANKALLAERGPEIFRAAYEAGVEIGFEASVTQGCDQGIEDVGDGAADDACLGQRARIGLVLERTPAVELELGEDVCGRG